MTTINIKNQDLVRKIKEAADRRQMGVTATLNEILDKHLEQRRPAGKNQELVQHWSKLVREARQQVDNPISSDKIGEFLYDENGLPK